MIAYFILLSAALAGFSGVPIWAVGATTIALAAHSHHSNQQLYRQGQALQKFELFERSIGNSALNALMACSVSYYGGIIFRLV